MTKRNKKKSPLDKNAEAYRQSQILLKDREEGYVPYDMILTSLEEVKKAFPKIILGDLLNFLGNEFYWKRSAGEALVLYGRNQDNDRLKGRGLVEICRFRVPEAWIGVGRFRIAWPNTGKDDESLFLIGLYLHSVNVNDFDHLVANENAVSAFMATLFLDKENGDLFDELAEERFVSLR